MNFDELIEGMKSFEGTEDYENYVAGLLNNDRVTKYFETDTGKKFIEDIKNAHFSKSLETWKKNKLDSLVNEEYKKRHPDADPKDAKVAELEAKLAKMEADSLRKDLTNKALTIATEKELPIELVNFFIGEDEETTTANIGKLETAFNDAVSKVVTKRLGESHKPDAGDDSKGFDPSKLNGLSTDEAVAYWKQLKNKK